MGLRPPMGGIKSYQAKQIEGCLVPYNQHGDVYNDAIHSEHSGVSEDADVIICHQPLGTYSQLQKPVVGWLRASVSARRTIVQPLVA